MHADAAQLGAEAATTASVVGGSRRGSTRTRSVVDTRRVPVPGRVVDSVRVDVRERHCHPPSPCSGDGRVLHCGYIVHTHSSSNNVFNYYVCVVPIYMWFVYDDIINKKNYTRYIHQMYCY